MAVGGGAVYGLDGGATLDNNRVGTIDATRGASHSDAVAIHKQQRFTHRTVYRKVLKCIGTTLPVALGDMQCRGVVVPYGAVQVVGILLGAMVVVHHTCAVEVVRTAR